MQTDRRCNIQLGAIISIMQHKALASVIHLLPCVSNTSLCLPHLLGLNEIWGLIMILLPAENSSERRFPSSVCEGDKPKTDIHMLSVLITVSATMMWLHVKKKKSRHYMDMQTHQPSCLRPLSKTHWCVFKCKLMLVIFPPHMSQRSMLVCSVL